MIRRHTVCCSIAVVGALLGPALVSATPAQGAARSRVVDVLRAYGDGPVVLRPGVDTARVRFAGRKGDRVTVKGGSYCPSELRKPDGSLLHRKASKFWRLPARATYTIRYDRCPNAKGKVVRLQLTKLVVHRLAADEALRLKKRIGYVQAAAVRVPATGRLQITPYDADSSFKWPDLVLPDGRRHRRGSWHFTAIDLALEAGNPVSQQDGPLPGLEATPLVAGERLLVLAWATMTIRASTPVVRPVVLDGEAVPAGNGGVPFRETQLEFEGEAGQWVYLEQDGELVPPDSFDRYHLLLDPRGRVLTRSQRPQVPYWQLPETGAYRMVLESGRRAAAASVRVRTVAGVGALPTDGTAVTFTATSPGQWRFATLVLPPDTAYRLHVVSADMTVPWRGFAETTHRFLCDIDGPLGCGDFDYVWVEDQVTDSTWVLSGYVKPGPWVVVVAPPRGGTGSVTLSLTPYTP